MKEYIERKKIGRSHVIGESFRQRDAATRTSRWGTCSTFDYAWLIICPHLCAFILPARSVWTSHVHRMHNQVAPCVNIRIENFIAELTASIRVRAVALNDEGSKKTFRIPFTVFITWTLCYLSVFCVPSILYARTYTYTIQLHRQTVWINKIPIWICCSSSFASFFFSYKRLSFSACDRKILCDLIQ